MTFVSRASAKSSVTVASGPIARSTEEWLMSRSCQSATFSIAGTTAMRTSRASPVRFSLRTGLRLCGMALEPFWPGAKYSSASSTSVRCRWRISIAMRSTEDGDHPERGEEHRVPVARDHLGRDRLDREPQLRRHVRLDRRVDVGEGPDRAGDRADRDLRPRRPQPRPVAVHLGVGLGELQPEGGGLGVDAVAAPDGRGQLVLVGPPLQRREQRVEIGDQDVRRPGELHAEAGVEHVRRGHALVHEARLLPDDLAEMGEERDHVVPGLRLDRVDAGDVELDVARLPDRLGGGLRDHPERGLRVRRVRLDLEPDAEPRLAATRSRPSRGGSSAGSCGRPFAVQGGRGV